MLVQSKLLKNINKGKLKLFCSCLNLPRANNSINVGGEGTFVNFRRWCDARTPPSLGILSCLKILLFFGHFTVNEYPLLIFTLLREFFISSCSYSSLDCLESRLFS